ncbi:D-glycerate dehydrogenase [Sporosarcina pasteurii]|uniref:Glyoxylate/hydroxypyruvate reductase B n=1 Tax=Sporosarcina pasteurii TaxID=1474 RepID=A0A380CD51_SPOPA|nr:D-glycerate dehydrogenase [Sporosarcina pasteurii]MDS9473093.1 D-glycerate dehydrogenase [Sporosarcina pasteurii]QBQ04257.1 D-glycerate dehydrogenase [Sporosarcina pasteurii]SUJ17058.1 Glyoxylate/hydroxypyruvate reductase B [Sporosarcina pasteurii]
MKPKVFLTYPVSEEVENYIAEHCELHKWDGEGRVPEEVLLEEIKNIDGLYTSGSTTGRIDERLLSHAPNLKVVSNVSVGYNNFDVEAMRKRNVIGTNTPHVLNETVADLAFALLLASARRIVELDKFVKAGNWKPTTVYSDTYGKDVHGATLGIIGMGRIGEAIARRAKFGFEMDVLYHNRTRKPDAEKKYEAAYRDLPTLLAESDYVILMTPLTSETFQLIGEEEFKVMKKSAVFINVSRGQTVDEQALIRALKNGEILAAGLDVFEKEPVNADNPLLTLPNVITVPHIGSATAKTEEKMAMRAAENLVAVLTGNQPQDPVWE